MKRPIIGKRRDVEVRLNGYASIDLYRQAVEREFATKMCLGCLVDERPHTCGYVPPPVIPEAWRNPT
jgi:hypothetical protein